MGAHRVAIGSTQSVPLGASPQSTPKFSAHGTHFRVFSYPWSQAVTVSAGPCWGLGQMPELIFRGWGNEHRV